MKYEFKPDWAKLPKLRDSIPLFDCYVAPCMKACPLEQNIPDMVSLVAEGKYAEAYAAILENNAIANITCACCPAECEKACARKAWDAQVGIREVERIAAEKGMDAFLDQLESEEPAAQRATVLGCTVTGLACSYYLARAGFDTCVRCAEESEEALAVRIGRECACPASAVLKDIQVAQTHGALFEFECADLSYAKAKKDGFDFVFFDEAADRTGSQNDQDAMTLSSPEDGSSSASKAADAKSAAEQAVARVLDTIANSEDEDDDCDCCGDDCDDDCDCGCGGHHHEHDHEHCHCGCGDDCHCGDDCCGDDCGCDCDDEDDEEYRQAEDAFFADIMSKRVSDCQPVDPADPGFARTEARRCMDCNYLCNRCVDVCPFGANIAVDMRCSENTNDPFQVVHVEHLCRHCGKCAKVCSHTGNPADDKFTFFADAQAFAESGKSGFMCFGDEITVRIAGKTTVCTMDRNGDIDGEVDDLVKELIQQVFLFHGAIFDSGN